MRNKFRKDPIRAVLVLLAIGSVSTGYTQVKQGFSTYVSPLIGPAGGGNTFPGAVVTWGMVSVSPHNDLKEPAGYKYGDPCLYGFGHTLLSGTGCADLGNIVLMPMTGEVQTDREKFR